MTAQRVSTMPAICRGCGSSSHLSIGIRKIRCESCDWETGTDWLETLLARVPRVKRGAA